jgi:membrane protease YdiL (CAAX protease family)
VSAAVRKAGSTTTGWSRLFPGLLLVGLLTLANLVLSTAWATLAFAVLVAVFVFKCERRLVDELRTGPKFDLATVATIITTLLGMVAFMRGYTTILRHFGVDVSDSVGDLGNSGISTLCAVLMTCVAAPVTEEIAFRGFLLARLDGVLGPTEALLVQAALFGIAHMLPLTYASHFLLGLALGFARRRTRSLYPGILVHAAYNAWALLM